MNYWNGNSIDNSINDVYGMTSLNKSRDVAKKAILQLSRIISNPQVNQRTSPSSECLINYSAQLKTKLNLILMKRNSAKEHLKCNTWNESIKSQSAKSVESTGMKM